MEHEFKVGDKVKVIISGRGVAASNMGKETIITKVGGKYMKGLAVKTKDFLNPSYDGWICCSSFTLVEPALTLEELMTELEEKINAKEKREKENENQF